MSLHLPAFWHLPAGDRQRYLNVPADLPGRVRTLAGEWARGAGTPREKALLIQRHLRTEYRYDLASPSPRARQPLPGPSRVAEQK